MSKPVRALLLLMILTCLPGTAPTARADTPAGNLFNDIKGVIALDPGHGGDDTGALGSEKIPEKEITLALVRRITTLMEPAYRIVLTRSDDYNVPLIQRTAVANNQKCDLLVSIHTAAAFMQATRGMAVYIHRPANDRSGKERPPLPDYDMRPWHRIQEPHIPQSRNFAATVQTMLQSIPGSPDVQTFQAPLVILEGADMPAILIEAGHLTNPADEKQLTTPEGRDRIAQAIVKAIESYLFSIRKTSSMKR